jgi:hypothetical protein
MLATLALAGCYTRPFKGYGDHGTFALNYAWHFLSLRPYKESDSIYTLFIYSIIKLNIRYEQIVIIEWLAAL